MHKWWYSRPQINLLFFSCIMLIIALTRLDILYKFLKKRSIKTHSDKEEKNLYMLNHYNKKHLHNITYIINNVISTVFSFSRYISTTLKTCSKTIKWIPKGWKITFWLLLFYKYSFLRRIASFSYIWIKWGRTIT